MCDAQMGNDDAQADNERAVANDAIDPFAGEQKEFLEASLRVLRENPVLVRPSCDVIQYCAQERIMSDIELFVASREYSKVFVKTPTALVTILVNNGYLSELTYVDGEAYSGSIDDLLADEGISEDAIIEHRYKSTPSGQEIAETFLPAKLISKLFDECPEHTNAFMAVLRMCVDGDLLTKEDIALALEGKDLVPHDARTGLPKMLPSYFTDKLERAGVLEWKHGWRITSEGRAFLEKAKL
ncbi:hypothetical protein [Adlercreutzia caecimuris]|uniref:hypothetical protein n=2 Tax=Adlercreutzia caecimuris TaxID=671266 RepID=UPI00272B5E4A|nr:hypothetical protein [Adlercreutzia caecimuris]